MATDSLADRIRDGIHRRGSMTMTDIIDRAIALGHTKREALEALQEIHRFKDITARTTGDTVTYTVTQIKQAKPKLMHWRPSPEQQASMDKELEDFIDKCPFLSDRERELYRIPSKDWTDDDHELMDTPLEYNLYMERKHGAPQWKRMKEDRIYSTL